MPTFTYTKFVGTVDTHLSTNGIVSLLAINGNGALSDANASAAGWNTFTSTVTNAAVDPFHSTSTSESVAGTTGFFGF